MSITKDCESDPQFGEVIEDAYKAACAAKSIYRIVDGWSFMLAWTRATTAQRADIKRIIREQEHHQLIVLISALTKDEDSLRKLREQAKKLGVDYLHSKSKQELVEEIASRLAVSGGTNGKEAAQQD